MSHTSTSNKKKPKQQIYSFHTQWNSTEDNHSHEDHRNPPNPPQWRLPPYRLSSFIALSARLLTNVWPGWIIDFDADLSIHKAHDWLMRNDFFCFLLRLPHFVVVFCFSCFSLGGIRIRLFSYLSGSVYVRQMSSPILFYFRQKYWVSFCQSFVRSLSQYRKAYFPLSIY